MARSTPTGYRIHQEGNRTVYVRDDDAARRAVAELGFLDGTPTQEPVGEVLGRVPHAVHALSGGRDQVLWKRGHRGGLVARVFGDRYHRTERFLRELEQTETARRAGVPVANILALALTRRGTTSHTMEMLIGYVPDSRDLADALVDPSLDLAVRRAIITAVARVIRQFHDLGLHHGDLNLKNVLVRGTEEVEAVLVDLDPAPRSRRDAHSAEGNLRRLTRSWLRISARTPLSLPATDRLRFLLAYSDGNRTEARALWDRLAPTVSRLRRAPTT